jgi:hypothetical protein
MNAGYVRNLVRHPRVRLKLRDGILARWHTGTAHVFSDDDPRKRQRWLAWSVTQQQRMRLPCDYSGPTCSRCGFVWMHDL